VVSGIPASSRSGSGHTGRAPRSSLFLPALSVDRADAAAQSGADEVVVDLEDSVPDSRKTAARTALLAALAALGKAMPVTVRINSSQDHQRDDLAACAASGVRSVLVPKVGDPADLTQVRHHLDALAYAPALGILIESSQAVLRLPLILTASGPLRSVALGNEDLLSEFELTAPTAGEDSVALTWAHGALILAAHGSSVAPLGISGSLTELEDMERFRSGALAARRMGYVGSYCIHPKQVPVLNRAFAPDAKDLSWARRVVEAAQVNEREGRGAFRVDGRMIDAPLIRRAERIIALADAYSRD
jgi:citrate lyase subunit beta/citryl-CoA lyase